MSIVNIIRGEDAVLAEFPYVALMGFLHTDGKMYYTCGGSVLNSKYALTAAHCQNGRLGPIR